ncbi:HAD family hydrolase [Azotosporobacter soli]|uniref:HAD family hydrolase n=1 Tax=Azotosporobacter soli TaxID=3055040 RepID=UPI0031FE5723
MKISWCVCDLDGSLLNNQGELTEETVQVLREIRENGVRLVLATGRSHLFVKKIAARLEVMEPVIACNGGLVWQPKTDQILQRRAIPEAALNELVAYCLEQRLDMLVYGDKHIYHTPWSDRAEKYRLYNERQTDGFTLPLQSIASAAELPQGKCMKAFLWEASPEMLAAIRSFKTAGQLTLVQSMAGATDIMATGVSKGDGLTFLAETIGLNLAETVAFGDNYNDISMLKQVRYSIAMGNGEAEVKAIAWQVTDSNEENGVAKALRKYVLVQ